MRKTLCIIAILTSVIALGQKMPSDYFQEASLYYENEKVEEALKSFQYIVDNYPKNELYPKAFYNIGCIYFAQKNYDKTIPVFKFILESDFNDKDNSGGGLMDNPYANYKHRASEILSDIYYAKEEYDTALYYFSLSDTKYPYLHFCGNEIVSNEIHKALKYADIYQKLKEPDKAIEKLLPFVWYGNNSEVIEQLQKLLVNKKGVKQEIDNSLKNLYIKTTKTQYNSYTGYYFMFLKVEIPVPDSSDDEKETVDKDKMIQNVKQTTFYKMIEQLSQQ